MKRFYYLFLSLVMVGFFVSCTKDTENIENFGQAENELASYEVTMLENGNELLTYPNGISVERTKEGLIFWQGDIVLSERQLEELVSPQTRSCIFLKKTWTNGVVYYEWASGIRENTKLRMLKAMQEWNTVCGLQFIDVTSQSNPPANRIKIINGNGNYSQVGMVRGVQELSIISDITSTCIHELGHAIGLMHEQCRYDRDNFIIVNYSNIKKDKRHNFDKVPFDDYKASSEFDFKSIMLYGSMVTDPAFVLDPSIPVMTKLDGSIFYENYSLSELDITEVNKLYRKKINNVIAKCECSLSGVVSGANDFTYLSICKLTANPTTGRKLEGWYEDNKKLSSANPYSFNVIEDRNIIAKFTTTNNSYSVETSVTMHFTSSGAKMGGSVLPGSHSHIANGSVTYTATPNAGFKFSYWEDMDSGIKLSANNPYYTSVKRDIRIRAVFAVNSIIILPQSIN